MKKLILSAMTGMSLFTVSSVMADQVVDELHIAGTYRCTGYDSHDGALADQFTLTLDPAASDFEHNFGAYTLTATDVGSNTINYVGEVSAHGDSIAMYFQNTDQKNEPTDYGVAIGAISRAQDSSGKYITRFTKFYYEPHYMRAQGGGHGTESCVKVN